MTPFAPHVGASEGIAFLNGDLYIAGGEGVRKIAADGTATMLAAVPATIGMVAWNGALYAASQSDGSPFTFCAPSNHGVIWKVTAAGDSEVFARGFISPNFIAVTPWNTLLVADDCQTNKTIYEVDEHGNSTAWSTSVTSANGMAFDATDSNLFVVNTFVRSPALYKIPLQADHSAGVTSTIQTFQMGTTPDGLAIDRDGNAYVALNLPGLIHKVTRDGTDNPFASGMTTPASLAFGNGPGFDPCSLYVTSLAGNDVYQVAVGTTGVPLLR
ncbi:MAG: SMP-30/gluconolactonase/LRE family protein [Deltaproteobacteria bacterium]|nr:SMP-30/gluconolactonase/LRE family protein [Deltaproteobacteria bacterium]